MRTRTLDEAIDAVSKLYCPHTVELTGRVRNTDAVPKVHHSASSQPLVELSSGAPVNIDAENFPRLFFMMRCACARWLCRPDVSCAHVRGRITPGRYCWKRRGRHGVHH
jgi:hypothetical protein